MAGTKSAEDIFEAEDGDPVGEQEAQCDTQYDDPPFSWLFPERGENESKHNDDCPAPMLAGTPEDPVCEGAVVLVNPVEGLGIDLLHIILVRQAASVFRKSDPSVPECGSPILPR